ncbi:unnamed protein product [Sphacelaria rigidula]
MGWSLSVQLGFSPRAFTYFLGSTRSAWLLRLSMMRRTFLLVTERTCARNTSNHPNMLGNAGEHVQFVPWSSQETSSVGPSHAGDWTEQRAGRYGQ